MSLLRLIFLAIVFVASSSLFSPALFRAWPFEKIDEKAIQRSSLLFAILVKHSSDGHLSSDLISNDILTKLESGEVSCDIPLRDSPKNTAGKDKYSYTAILVNHSQIEVEFHDQGMSDYKYLCSNGKVVPLARKMFNGFILFLIIFLSALVAWFANISLEKLENKLRATEQSTNGKISPNDNG